MGWINYKDGIRVAVDITEKCNALCPQCLRTDVNEGGIIKPIDELGPKELSLDKFKEWFPRSAMENIKSFDFTCNAGDPAMHRDLFELTKYVLENSRAEIDFTTNGSIRNEDWWWEYGVLGKRRLKVKFSIDGINQEMHEKYRVGTNLDKILKNMSSIASTKAHVETITILFKHNQEYLEDILKLARDHGAKETRHTQSLRFKRTNELNYTSPDGKDYKLEKIISTDNNWTWEKYHYWEPYDHKTHTVSCRYDNMDMVYVSIDGIVWPCCFTAIFGFYRNAKEYILEDKRRTPDNPFYKMAMDLESYSLNNKTLNEIMENPFYKKDLMDSLGENPDRVCRSACWVKR